MLEEEHGLAPIPVYHPLNDGWDYFDTLAQRYDRICMGNVVQASPSARKRLITTAWERHRKYPHLWIHLLGYTPHQTLNALPMDSCDSSTWLSGVRWPDADREAAACQTFTRVSPAYTYAQVRDGATPEEQSKWSARARMLMAYRAWLRAENWRSFRERAGELWGEAYPPVTAGTPTAPGRLTAEHAEHAAGGAALGASDE
jgi:hypothetical protein